MRRAAVMFFAREAGYATPPGRLTCAWSLAEAEALGAALGWRVTWEQDMEQDLSWCDRCEKARADRRRHIRRPGPVHEHVLFGAILKDARGQVLESLWGIDFGPGDPDPAGFPYRRVVEAELMLAAVYGARG